MDNLSITWQCTVFAWTLFCALHIDSGWKHCNNVPEKSLAARMTSSMTGRQKTMHHFIHQRKLMKQNLLLKTEWSLWISLPIKVHKPKAEYSLVQNCKNLELIKRIPHVTFKGKLCRGGKLPQSYTVVYHSFNESELIRSFSTSLWITWSQDSNVF